MFIKRDDYLNKLISYMHNGKAKVVTGIRRCGKSKLFEEIFIPYLKQQGVDEDHIIYYPLDNDLYNHLLNPIELSKTLRDSIKDNKMYYFILDEIQNVYTIVNPIFTDGKIVLTKKDDERAFSYFNVLNGLIQTKNADVYVTGSNAKELSYDLATEFRGRSSQIHMQPLSFKEIVESTSPMNIDAAFEEYMRYGGLPEILSYSTDEDKMHYLNDTFDSIYHRDIEQRYNINNPNEFETLIRIMSSCIGSPINQSTIEDTFKSKLHINLNAQTIATYLKYLQDAFILSKVNRYDIKGRKEIGATYKYYFADPGLRNSRQDFLHNDEGHMMENIIYNELIKRGYSVQIGNIDAYSKDKNNKTIRKKLEIDFIATLGDKYYYIQSAYQLDETNKDREIRPLLKVDNSFKKFVIIHDTKPIERDKYGITYIDIKKFLLNDNSLSTDL